MLPFQCWPQNSSFQLFYKFQYDKFIVKTTLNNVKVKLSKIQSFLADTVKCETFWIRKKRHCLEFEWHRLNTHITRNWIIDWIKQITLHGNSKKHEMKLHLRLTNQLIYKWTAKKIIHSEKAQRINMVLTELLIYSTHFHAHNFLNGKLWKWERILVNTNMRCECVQSSYVLFHSIWNRCCVTSFIIRFPLQCISCMCRHWY